jgi:hypothetical protein
MWAAQADPTQLIRSFSTDFHGRETSPSKSFAIVADSSQEGASHCIGAGKAAARRDTLQRGFALLEQSPRRIDPRHFDEIRGCSTGLALKHTRKIPHAHCDPTCQRFEAQVLRKMIQHPMLQGSNPPLVGDLRRHNANIQFNGANNPAYLNHVQNSHATPVPPRRYHAAVVRTVRTAPYSPLRPVCAVRLF